MVGAVLPLPRSGEGLERGCHIRCTIKVLGRRLNVAWEDALWGGQCCAVRQWR
jgi:hypothetical protein